MRESSNKCGEWHRNGAFGMENCLDLYGMKSWIWTGVENGAFDSVENGSKFVSFHLIHDSFFAPLHLTPFIMVLSWLFYCLLCFEISFLQHAMF